jgi:hypothetical protein
MKIKNSFFVLILFFLIISGCKKDSTQNFTYVPTLTTANVTSLTQTTAQSGGDIVGDGGSTIISSGVCWDTNPNPTINLTTKTVNANNNTGNFVSNLSGLTINTTYYLRAYANNSVGTGYGNQVTFTTPTYLIGQSYGGGVIFYIDNTGIHGLIAAATDQNKITDQTTWNYNNIDLVTNAISLTNGSNNTQLIINVQGNSGNYAALIAKNYNGGGFNDWFLPSVNQLQTLFSAVATLQPSSYNVNSNAIFYASFGGIYWSSSEASKDGAYVVGFTGQSQVFSKSANNSSGYALVRTIRAF